MVLMPELLILGGVMLLGIVGKLLFSKTHIPESLYLIIAGMIIGPILGWIHPEFFRDNMSFLITIALVIVLLDSGLKLDLYRIWKNTLSSIIYTITAGVVTTALVAFAMYYIFMWEMFNAVFLGIIISGTTTVTIAHLIDRLTIDQKTVVTDTKTILFVESVLSDILVIGAAAIMLTIASVGELSAQELSIMVFNTFVVGILAGFMLGVVWAFLYAWKLHGNKLSYIFTLGVALCVFAIAEYLGLNGALTVAVFAIVVGNHEVIVQIFRVRSKFFKNIDKDISALKKTDVEFTFLITTFFFVILGVIFRIDALFNVTILTIAGVILVLKIIARYGTTLLVFRANPSYTKARTAHTTMMSCGLASALTAFLAIDAQIPIPQLAEIVVLMIILTTFVAIFGTWLQESITAQAQSDKK